VPNTFGHHGDTVRSPGGRHPVDTDCDPPRHHTSQRKALHRDQRDPRLLPLAAHVRGKRSPVTCRLKCDACAGPECNTSGNPHFRDIASAAISRRALLGFGAAGAVVLATDAFGYSAPGAAAAPAGAAPGGLPFTPIAPVARTVDQFTVPTGYDWTPIIRWGDPVLFGAPEFDATAQTVESQAGQFGYNNDFLAILEDPDSGGTRGVLVANHEYVNPAIMFPATTDAAELRRRSEIYKMAHGMSVVELERSGRGEPWRYVREGEVNRRITAETPFELTGPAAGSGLLKTKGDPAGRRVLGTLNNCAGGVTPWGTILSGEENFNQYFNAPASAERSRYGLAAAPTGGTSTGWEKWDPRFDASTADYANEPNRFGWIVEIDPEDPTSTPRKHTALGRFKHEGANVIVGEDGRVVAYMGDDERGDYLYKFVSKNKFKKGNGHGARRQNMQLLAEGDLFVARFRGDSPASEIDGTGALPSDGAFDGSGEWIPLTRDGASAVPGMSVDEVLVYTRLAADRVGATRMDRPEDVEPSLKTGKIYVACTNNSSRGTSQPVDEANPRTGNRDGHIIEISETAGQGGRTFGWSILLLCGNPATNQTTYFAGFPRDKVSPISCPDNIAFDSEGNLWISTDGAPSVIGFNDALFKVPLTGSGRGHVQQFLAVPTEAETSGPVIHDTDGSVFVSVQHPGEDGTWEAQRSYFPDYASGNAPGIFRGPRPSVVQVTRT
jgi:secreted PhoX family phosphatase